MLPRGLLAITKKAKINKEGHSIMIHPTLLLIIGPQLDLVCLPYGAVILRRMGNKMSAKIIQNTTMVVKVPVDNLNICQLSVIIKKGAIYKKKPI